MQCLSLTDIGNTTVAVSVVQYCLSLCMCAVYGVCHQVEQFKRFGLRSVDMHTRCCLLSVVVLFVHRRGLQIS